VKHISLIYFLFAFIYTLSSQSIFSDPDLKVWLKADTGVTITDGKVSSWADVSGNNHDFYQNTILNRPNLSASTFFANHSVLNFDGTNEYILNDLINDINTEDLSIFIISSGLAQGNVRSGLFCVNAITNGLTLARSIGNLRAFRIWVNLVAGLHTGSQSVSNDTYLPNILSFKREVGIISNIYLNGILKSTNTSTGYNAIFTNGIARIGIAPGYQYFKGSIAEIIIFNRVLNEVEQEEVELYLMDKYAPPIILGPDISINYGFCDTTLSSTNYYSSYLWNTGSTDSSIVVADPGLYWLETVDVFDRVTRDSIIVAMPLRDSLILDDEFPCFNEPLTINAFIPQGNYQFVSWSDGNTNPTRILTQNETISYTVADSLGCTWTSNDATMSVDNSLEGISLGSDTSLCVGNTLALDQTPTSITNYLWNTGNISSNQVVDTSGTYILDVINDNGCENSDTIEITIIGDAPTLSYSIPTEICQGSELSYSESSTVPPGNNISGLIWDFGDSDSSVVSSGSHVYVDSGAFNASLEVFTLEGCKSKDEFIITVFPKPIVSFETENYCPYEEIGFTPSNSYAVPLDSYNWDLGQGGTTSTNSNPTHIYNTSGNFDVQLIAIDTNNCSDTVAQSVYIQPAPMADILILNPCELSALEITDNSSMADTFSIVTYSWDYGDNTNAVNPVEDKFYELYGEYTVQLALTANNGCVDSIEQNITVHPNPIVDYAVGPACMGTWTTLTDLSVIPMGSLAETNWLINLQYTDNLTNTAFNFPTTGIQLVALQSTSDQGCAVDTTFTIDVSDELKADFLVTPSAPTTGTPILFSNQSIGMDSSFWDFGDGNGILYNMNSLNEITYDGSLNGSSIDVSLVIVNNLGCRDTSAQSYELKEAFFDLSVQTIFVQDINGFLTVGAEIQNLGSVPLENAELYLKTPENSPILENWTGFLAQNESEIYIFNAHPPSYTSTQDETERFICVEGNGINSLGYLDVDFSNNTACKNIEGSGLVVLPIYPNPTEEDITLSILLTETSTVHIELIDQRGRMVLNQKQTENLEAGIHTFRLPFSELNKGVYFVRVSDGNTTLLEKIVRY